jgi:heme/copper-type cytochrome/quinol oxidase subunit 2
MNPFGIFEAVLFALEVAVDALNPKRKKETKREQRWFLFWYFLFLFLTAAVVIWVVYNLYFAK